METTDGIWVPGYYRHRHPLLLWVRDVGKPRTADWVAGAICAALVLGLLSLARGAQHPVTPSAAVEVAVATTTAAQNEAINANRVAYVPQTSTVEK